MNASDELRKSPNHDIFIHILIPSFVVSDDYKACGFSLHLQTFSLESLRRFED